MGRCKLMKANLLNPESAMIEMMAVQSVNSVWHSHLYRLNQKINEATAAIESFGSTTNTWKPIPAFATSNQSKATRVGRPGMLCALLGALGFSCLGP